MNWQRILILTDVNCEDVKCLLVEANTTVFPARKKQVQILIYAEILSLHL